MGEPARQYIEERPARRRQIEIIQDPPQPVQKRGRRQSPKKGLDEKGKGHAKKARVKGKKKAKPQARTARMGQRALFTPAQGLSLFVMLTAFVGLLIANLISYNEVSIVQNQINETRQKVQALQSETDLLTMKMAPYTDPDRIERLARERLQMVKPQDKDIISIHANPKDVYKDPGSQNQLADQGR